MSSLRKHGIFLLFLALALTATSATTRESYLVSNFNNGLSVFDLKTHNLISLVHAGDNNFAVAVGQNPRIAFLSTGFYLSVVDLTLQREITRLPPAPYSRALAFTPDGKYLLTVNGNTFVLEFVNVSTFKVDRQVTLVAALHTSFGFVSSIVVANGKAYVSLRAPSPGHPAIAEVDLSTFVAKSFAIPNRRTAGGRTLHNIATTPDGKYLVLVQGTTQDPHMLLFDTATGQLAIDRTLPYVPFSIAITPPGNDPSKTYGYLLHSVQNGLQVTLVDLIPNSPTFGQLIPNTDVNLAIGSFGLGSSGLALNPTGTMLVFAGEQPDPNMALPNIQVIDTALMLTNPSNAVIAKSVSANGTATEGVAVANISTSIPPTAPVVSSINGNITNDKANVVHIFGSNFASDSFVRVGSMAPARATFFSSTHIAVTVPANAPGGQNLDLIVTNPNLTAPVAQQNQSGRLAGGINIGLNPAFQPKNQFALTYNNGSVQVYELQQRAMATLAPADPVYYSSEVLNLDGRELYGLSSGPAYWQQRDEGLQWNLTDNSFHATVMLPSSQTLTGGYFNIASALSVQTHAEAIYVPTTDFIDLYINIIDSNPASKTYNTVLTTLAAGLNTSDSITPYSVAVTPDGAYAYLSYDDFGTSDNSMLAIFSTAGTGPTTLVNMSTLGASTSQYYAQLSPDGKYLLLQGFYQGTLGTQILVFDLSKNPKNPTLLASLKGTVANHASPLVLSTFQVAGNRLFAFDSKTNSVLTFTFDPVHMNFAQLGTFTIKRSYDILTASPDAALVYLTSGATDQITVLDGNALANSQPPLITSVATGHYVNALAISPVAHTSAAHQPAVVPGS